MAVEIEKLKNKFVKNSLCYQIANQKIWGKKEK
jgi:hypothetical protein